MGPAKISHAVAQSLEEQQSSGGHEQRSKKMEGYISKANQILEIACKPNTQKLFTQLLKECKGLAILSVYHAGAVMSMHYGTGIVMAKKKAQGGWSAPSAALVMGYGMGAVAGGKVDSTIVFIMDDKTLRDFAMRPQTRIGLDAAAAVGKHGGDRNIGMDQGTISMTFSKGAYVGAGLQMGTLVTQEKENEKFYGKKVRAKDILLGEKMMVDIQPNSQLLDFHLNLERLTRGDCWIPTREDMDSWSRIVQQAGCSSVWQLDSAKAA